MRESNELKKCYFFTYIHNYVCTNFIKTIFNTGFLCGLQCKERLYKEAVTLIMHHSYPLTPGQFEFEYIKSPPNE